MTALGIYLRTQYNFLIFVIFANLLLKSFFFYIYIYSIDATAENGTFGRLLNHSRCGNCKTKLHAIKNKPHLILIADRDVEEGEELTYDYGDRSKDAIESHPWLKS